MDAIDGIEGVRAIAWDFDGVLNVAGEGWRAVLQAELGLDPEALAKAVLTRDTRALMTGAEDILDRLEAWCDGAGAEGAAEDILELLLEGRNDPDRDLLRLIAQLDRAGIAQVLALNTDSRRARYLALEGGWAERVDAIFASAEMGAMKPDATFFQQIEEALALAPHEILLIDASERITDAAEKRGWLGWTYAPGGAMALARALMPLLLRGAQDN